MRKTEKFVLSKKALNDESGPKAITLNIKSGEVIKVSFILSRHSSGGALAGGGPIGIWVLGATKAHLYGVRCDQLPIRTVTGTNGCLGSGIESFGQSNYVRGIICPPSVGT